MDSSIPKFNTIDIRRLRIFMTIVEHRGFVNAQNQLGLSAASISLHMRALEGQLETTLCMRGRSGFKLTPQGERIYKAARQFMLAHNDFQSAVGEAKGKLTGELRLGVIDNAVFDPQLAIPALLSRFRKLAPEVGISLYTLSPTELENAVYEQRLHLAIGVFYEKSKHFNYQTICHENLTLYCGKAHPLFDDAEHKLKLSTLSSYEFVERTYGETLGRLNKSIQVKKTAYTSSLEAALLLILSGHYIGFLPEYYAAQWVKQKKIKPLLARKLHIKTKVAVLTHKNPENAAITNLLLSLMPVT